MASRLPVARPSSPSADQIVFSIHMDQNPENRWFSGFFMKRMKRHMNFLPWPD